MTTENLTVFLLAYCLCTTTLMIGFLFMDRRSVFARCMVFTSVCGLVAAVIFASWLSGNSRVAIDTIFSLTSMSRPMLASFLMGVCCSLPFGFWVFSSSGKGGGVILPLLTIGGMVGTIGFAGILAAKDVISPYLSSPDSQFGTNSFGNLTPEEFTVEQFIDTELIPVRIAVSPSGRIFVSGHLGVAAQEGGIAELVEKNGAVQEILVARMLNRPYGLVATDDALYVSRSGQYSRWKYGKSDQVSTGAVTLLKDTDQDGIMDYYHDIVDGLPGAKGPDYLHQNNGIVLDGNGDLYITTANHTDGAPVNDPLAGAILRATGEQFENISVFASGLRNPFGLALNSDGSLIATDNDPQSGLLGNLGDKLLRVSEGDHFGHPYANDSDPDVREPLLRSRLSLGGLVLATSESLPDKFKNNMFVVVYGEGRIMKIAFTENDKATLEPFATVPGAVDIAAAPNGDFYVAVYPDKVVRLKLLNK